MAEITAQAVNEFRKATGLGLMECKALLKEAAGDIKLAMTLAKERGMKQAELRAGRAASMGLVVVKLAQDGRAGAIVEVNCETDFVARNETFIGFVESLANHVLAQSAAPSVEELMGHDLDGTSVKETMMGVNAKTGENVAVARVARLAVDSGRVEAYVHHDQRNAAIVAVEAPAGADTAAVSALAKELALQVVAARPLCVRREEVSSELVEEQRRIFFTQVEDKPEPVRPKIVEGKLNAWYGEVTLLDQPSVKEPGKTVRELVKAAGPGLEVTGFVRFSVGEAPSA